MTKTMDLKRMVALLVLSALGASDAEAKKKSTTSFDVLGPSAYKSADLNV